ncbi:hypothetical protein [Methylobacterium sp. E-066]|uniref:hypothetical protein n=1 Tax=Methylobacterium sp. E-066 TaxID=2836584 RepID=UPI001FB9B5D5|nr:hypothetical protein [Methylobacterium sp. E-066]MCJ2142818.1 hypothetical protein [Methylobacterium sp. E-066]
MRKPKNATVMLEENRQTIAEALATPDVDKVAVMNHALFARHTMNKRLRRTTMSVHQSDGYSSEHVRNVDWFLTAVRQCREFDDVSEMRMVVAVQATLGIARALTDNAYDRDPLTLGMIENETVALIKKARLP